MPTRRTLFLLSLCLIPVAAVGTPAGMAPPPVESPRAVLTAGQVDPSVFAEMRWRAIGPHRGGRTKAVVGVPGQPYTFYIGVCNGGVWKTTDAGRSWRLRRAGRPGSTRR